MVERDHTSATRPAPATTLITDTNTSTNTNTNTNTPTTSHPLIYLASGAIAGLSVDIVLFPLDTIKTRLQSSIGFRRSGGFSNVYAGLSSAAAGSAPSAALFFLTYEASKRHLPALFSLRNSSLSSPSSLSTHQQHAVHSLAAAFGEVAACLVRVPTDNVKQKLQASLFPTPIAAIRSIVQHSGIAGFYLGFYSTLLREIPFSLIQFPLYEFCKSSLNERRARECSSIELAGLGSATGALAAACTTPMDVVKTRLMLLQSHERAPSVLALLHSIYKQGGVPALFAGIVPRVLWIGLGGAVFLGGYEFARKSLLSAQAHYHASSLNKVLAAP